MKKCRFKYLLLLFAILFSTGFANASHLVGGSLGYEYLGYDSLSGLYRYRILLTVYNNCDSLSAIPFPIAQQDVNVYEQDIANNPMGGGDKVLYATVTTNLIDSTLIEPALPGGCSIGQGTCIYEGIYEGFIDVPVNFNGFHLYFENFARNASITNLQNPGGQGMAFHAYIPPTLVDNSSPIFTDVPVPFLCVNDTVTILNTAIDPDGDQLIFSFVEPFQGGGNQNPLQWTIPAVNYAGGYNMAQPFGAGGYSFINGATGLTAYMSPQTGNFVVAVEIREYRNGNLIGVSRRDLQLLVINCPPNNSPNLDPMGGGINYSVEEGQTLCFDLEFYDVDGDSLTLTGNGEALDTTYTNPAGTLIQPVSGDSVVSSTFCWTTACGQGQPLPYLFSVSVTDDGCPPKTTSVVYSITVNPFQGPTNISGPLIVCENDTGATYTATNIPGATYTWSVTGGNITSGQGSNVITVDWGTAGPGLVEVFATSSLGCPSSPIDVNITILPNPNAAAGADTTICPGDTAMLGGSPTGPPGASYSWSPTTGLDDPNIANPMANPSATTTYVVTVDVGGLCVGTDTVVVTIASPLADAGPDVDYCPGDSAQLGASGATSYLWTPSTDLSDPTIADPWASPPSTTTYYVTMVDAGVGGCTVIDSVLVTVHNIPLTDAGPDTTICAGSSVMIGGSPTGPPGATFSWTPAGTLDDATLANPTATPTTSPTTYIVVATNVNSCTNSDTVVVTLNPLPIVDAGPDTTICFNDSVPIGGTPTGPVNATYSWTPTTGLSNASASNPNASPATTTTYIVTVTDTNGCVSTDTMVVNVNPLPIVDAGPDVDICIGDSVMIGGSPTGPAGSVYSWAPAASLSDGAIANPMAGPSITTTYIVTVTDINGCINTDTVIVTVNPLPIVDAGPDTTICDGSSVVIGGSPTGPAGSTYAWIPIGTLNDPALANPTATPTVSPTTYVVVVTDINGCVSTDSMVVTLNPLPVVDAGNDATICLNDSVPIGGAPTGPAGSTYSWTPTTGLSNANDPNPNASPAITTTYTVTVTDINGCVSMDSMIVNVNPLPIVDAGQDVEICIGDSTMLGGSPTGPAGSVYSWTPAASLSDGTIANPMAGPSVTTTYIVTVTDINGCINTDTVIVTVNPLPIVDAGADVAICAGDSTQLNATGGVTYSWTPTTGLSDPNIADPWATPASSTTYYVTVTDINGCVNTDSVTVTTNALPVITAGPDTTICFSDTIQLFATGGATYSWSPTTGLSDPNIANPMASPSDTTVYIVTVTTGNNCVGTDTVTINVNPLPPADAGMDVWLCPGDNVQLNATGGITYSWSPTTGLNDPNIADPIASPTDSTTYIVTVTDGNGCSANDTVVVIVNDEVPTDAGADTTICEGDSVMIGGAPTSLPGTTYLWAPAASLDDPSLPNPTAFPTVTTTYIVYTTNDTCTNSDTITVFVNPSPPADAGADMQVCIGDSVQLNASGGIIYSWTPSTGLSDPNVADPMASPNDTTMYYVTVTDTNGCSATDSAQVIVNPLPTVDAGIDMQICIGDSIQLTATGGVGYSWTPTTGLSDPNIADPWASPNDTTMYYVTVTDSNMCVNIDSMTVIVNPLPVVDAGMDVQICIGDSTQLNASGGDTYIWSPTNDLSDPNIANPWASPTDTMMYYVTVTDSNLCVNIDSVAVIVNPLPAADAGADTQICIGDGAQLNASGGDTYTWSPTTGLDDPNIANPIASPTDTTTYIVTVVDSNLCVNTDTVTVIVNPLPAADAGSDINICRYDTVQLNASGGVLYSWSPAVWIDDPNIPNPNVYPDTTMMYTVTVTDSNMCVNTDSITVVVFRIEAGPDTAICFGQSAQLWVTPTNAVTYSWSPAAGLSDPNIANPIATPTATTTYTVTVTDAQGCVDVATVEVIVNPNPTASFDTEFKPSCDGVEVTFTNTSMIADSYYWDFGDGNSSTEENPTYLFPYSDTYNVTMVASNSNGCSDTASFGDDVQRFEDYFDIVTPNVFTPNNDGVNDLFSINVPGHLSPCVDLRVYNRWGQLMFVSTSHNIVWDGRTSTGVKVPEGTYFYTLNINGIEYRGSVMLME